ncbi:hypothetical protein TSUD_411390 [Trifolium subterraneum]|uniref:Peptidase A1 domain-containing protein n=1 Tax=Trifolium subterraneum TaxID=3900 RepID=A0A2Z6P5F4_TRISU|nr:hypothetical protein TSUD_411390 [Trifolium subterraneum]
MTQGVLAQETLTLTSKTGEPVSLRGITFGCGHNNNGGVVNDEEMGVIGLGRRSLSLISQIGSSLGGNMFSQCLVPSNTNPSITSHMSFGHGSEVLGNDVVSTPLVFNDASNGAYDTQYFVTLLGISVEDINLPSKNDSSLDHIVKGNMMIDSGTPTILLPEEFYHRLMEKVRDKVSLEPIPDSISLGYQLCYRTQTNFSGPMLTAHFEAVTWKANQQSVVALSTTQAEYIALVEGVKEAIWLKGMIGEMGINQGCVKIHCDSQSAIHLANHQVYHERTKHIDIRLHFVRDMIETKEIIVEKVASEENPADMFTKSLPRVKFKHCLELINFEEFWSWRVAQPQSRATQAAEKKRVCRLVVARRVASLARCANPIYWGAIFCYAVTVEKRFFEGFLKQQKARNIS